MIGPATRIYVLLLRLLPRSFRQEYGEELVIDFHHLIDDAYLDYGALGVFSVSLGAMWDVVRAAIREHWQETLLQKVKLRLSAPCTPRVHEALRLADQEAQLVEDQCCSGGHILIGLLREGGGIAGQALRKIGITVVPLRNRIALLTDAGTPGVEITQQVANRQQVLALAHAEASKLGHRFVGTEHVLLGLLNNDAGFLATALDGVGVSSRQVHEATLSLINQRQAKSGDVKVGAGRTIISILKAVIVIVVLILVAATAVRVFGQDHPAAVSPQNRQQDSKGIRAESVRIPLNTNNSLEATLILPASGNHVPAILMIPGYANPDEGVPKSRDETGSAGFVLGRYIASQGFAVLRVPFGEGSTGNEPSLSVSDLADRALQCTDYLKKRPDIDPARIGILGHSAGGGIAAMAAVKSPDAAFLILAASPVESVESTVLGLIDNVLRAGGASEADRVTAKLQQERVFAAIAKGAKREEIRPELEQLLRSVYGRLPEDQLRHSGKNIDELVKSSTDRQLKTLTSPWFRSLLGFDPPNTLAKLHCPALILFAEKDQKIDPLKSCEIAKTALEKSGTKDWDVQIIHGADHSFGLPEQGAASSSAEQQFAHEFLERLQSWLSKHHAAN
jgi:dienelactone hydrolase